MRAILRISNHMSRDYNDGVPYDDVEIIIVHDDGYEIPNGLISESMRRYLRGRGCDTISEIRDLRPEQAAFRPVAEAMAREFIKRNR